MYQKAMEKVARIQEIVEKVRNIASATYKMPDFKYGSVINAFGGPRFDIESLGGTKLAENLISAAESYAARFAQRQLDAAKTKLQAELERRKKEWLVEDEVADAEVAEIEKEEVVNEIKVQQVEKEQKNIEREILRSEEIYDVLSEKFTNNDLYIWLEKELGKVFRQYVKTLLEVAQMAEKAYHFEIPNDTNNKPYIQTNYWDSFYKGLLAPERILLDLRRMEKAYLKNDEHKTTITEPIVIETNLMQKIIGGSCSITIADIAQKVSEYNENMRILDMRVQIICNTPVASYTRLYAKLSLTSSLLENRHWATGMSLSDAGKFEFIFRDDRYLPFEGANLTDSFTLYLKRDQDDEVNYNNAKVVLFVTYTV